MKIMICQSRKNKTVEEFKAERSDCVEMLNGYGYTIVDNVFPDYSSDKSLFFLGKEIQMISDCESVYFLEGWSKDKACSVIRSICQKFNIKMIGFDK